MALYAGGAAMLLHGDGADGSTVFTDETGKTVTPYGNASIRTAQSKFGETAMRFTGTGSGSYAHTGNSDGSLSFDADFTIEAFFCMTAVHTENGILTFFNSLLTVPTANEQGLSLRVDAYNRVIFGGGQANLTTPNIGEVVANTWCHAAGVRQGNEYRLYLNGVLRVSYTVGTPANRLHGCVGVGVYDLQAGKYFSGYIKARVTKGVARYTADFTPQMAAFATTDDPHYANVTLLLNGVTGAPAFVDSSTYGKTLTLQGAAAIALPPLRFGGSSMYFDGVGDYLGYVANDEFYFSNADFTVEGWAYVTANVTSTKLLIGRWGSTLLSWNVVLTGTNKLAAESSASGAYEPARLMLSADNVFSANTWFHWALTRFGNVLTLWCNGISVATLSVTGALFDTSLPLTVGANSTGSIGFGGYLEDVRITKGVAHYTATFTPPALPFTLGITSIAIQAPASGPIGFSKYDPSQAKPVISEVKDDLQDSWPYGPWTTPTVQFEFKGRGVITGTVAEKALPANTPLRRLVRLHREPDGAFVRATWSDAVTGNYSFNGVRADHKYFVTSFDYAGTYRAVIADNLVPTPL